MDRQTTGLDFPGSGGDDLMFGADTIGDQEDDEVEDEIIPMESPSAVESAIHPN
jgi:hypothetical protein